MVILEISLQSWEWWGIIRDIALEMKLRNEGENMAPVLSQLSSCF